MLNKKFPGLINGVSVFDTSDDSDHYNYDDEYFHLESISAITEFLSGDYKLLKMRDIVTNDFGDFIKALTIICKKSTKDVLEVLLKVFNLTEIYLTADIKNNILLIRYEIARESTDILRKHTPEHYRKFKKDVQNVSFSDYDIQLHINGLNEIFIDSMFLRTKLEINESAATHDIQFP